MEETEMVNPIDRRSDIADFCTSLTECNTNEELASEADPYIDEIPE